MRRNKRKKSIEEEGNKMQKAKKKDYQQFSWFKKEKEFLKLA
jgi:hypothetical protein